MLAIALSWSIAAAHAIYYSGDRMMGFAPLVLLSLPGCGCLALAALIAACLGKSRFTLMAMASAMFLAIPFLFGHLIERMAWTGSIRRFEAANVQAIGQSPALPELTDEAVRSDLYRDESLPILKGFEWYCEHEHASPNGAFRAFVLRGVVHVRIQKVRHGYRGIAFLPNPGDKPKLETAPALDYEGAVGNRWLVWNSVDLDANE